MTNTTHSVAAFVCIESLYPSPEGGELTPDSFDLSLLGVEEGKIHKSTVAQGRQRFTKDGIERNQHNEFDYEGFNGYYRILPLNILSIDVGSSKTNNKFSVSFTIDDLVLFSEDRDNPFTFSTAVPQSIVENPSDEGLAFRKIDTNELGISQYRITSGNVGFNIEDLIKTNDVVTIWIYNDPQDFIYRRTDENGQPIIDKPSIDDMQYVIGSGNRKSQFNIENPTFTESFLNSTGIINEFFAESLELQMDSINKEDLEEKLSDIKVVTKDNFFSIIQRMYVEANSEADILEENDEELALKRYLSLITDEYSGNDTSVSSDASIIYEGFLKFYSTNFASRENENGSFSENDGFLNEQSKQRNNFESLINELNKSALSDEDDNSMFYDISKIPVDDENFNLLIDTLSISDINQFVHKANELILYIERKKDEYIEKIKDNVSISAEIQEGMNGRKILSTKSHGETAYQLIKGHVGSVNVKVGTEKGTNIITVSGHGYEKIPNTTAVYYEDLINVPEGVLAGKDFATIYTRIQPAKAMLHMVNKWMAKSIVIGADTTYNRMIHDSYLIQDPIESIKTGTDEDNKLLKNSFDENNAILRGIYLVGKAYLGEEEIEGLRTDLVERVFTPLNYLDTTRMKEMVNSITESYKDPDKEGIINTYSSPLSGSSSLMQNLRAIGGAGQFYDLFIDALGKLRYRISFEAMERMPRPELSPTIRDSDVRNGANFSFDDTNLVTLVDVVPREVTQGGQASIRTGSGRSVPPNGRVPINLDGYLKPRMVSPQFFRHGLRRLRIDDVYQNDIEGSARKAELYRRFYGKPIKKASIPLTRLENSYSVGETLLVCLQKNTYRSKTVFDYVTLIGWAEEFLKSQDENFYKTEISVDKRLINKDFYQLTRDSDWTPIPDSTMFNAFSENPYKFSYSAFKQTFEWLDNILGGQQRLLTPEYFPCTLWYFLDETEYKPLASSQFIHWDDGTYSAYETEYGNSSSSVHNVIIDLHAYLLRGSVLGETESINKAKRIINQYEGIINAVRFQNFRCTQYYISGVQHRFNKVTRAIGTNLSLDFGQDSLVLLEPRSLLPISSISIERKMRANYFVDNQTEESSPYEIIAYNDSKETQLGSDDFSALYKLYYNQRIEDEKFKKSSFFHRSQEIRNSTNYLYQVAKKEGLDYGIEISIDQSPVQGVGGVKTKTLRNLNDGASASEIFNQSNNTPLSILNNTRDYFTKIAFQSDEDVSERLETMEREMNNLPIDNLYATKLWEIGNKYFEDNIYDSSPFVNLVNN